MKRELFHHSCWPPVRETRTALCESDPAREAAVEHRKDPAVGMFIHWGPVSLMGAEIGCCEAASGVACRQ